MNGIFPLSGTIQHYAWGGQDYLPQLLKQTKQENQFYAEYWLGSHNSAPSKIKIAEQELSLVDFIQQNPCVLGKQSRAAFGEELPYLLKILDVKLPLSIQLHPTKKQAEIGFAAENAKGIALNDPKRTYKDNNHKPEMMIALSEFWLLHGFQTKDKIRQTFKTRPSLTALLNKLDSQDLHSFYAEIMQSEQTQLAEWLLPLINANQTAYNEGKLSLDNPDYWLLYSMETMNISNDKLDAGLVCFYLFNIVKINQGEGIFQDAGIPHAYLRGQNIELMACSDNVIRGGLTPKHVDIPALLEVIDCREVTPQIISAAPQTIGGFTYQTPAKDFALERLGYEYNTQLKGNAENGSILLVMQGKIALNTNGNETLLTQGQSAFICAETEYQIKAQESGYAVIAKLP